MNLKCKYCGKDLNGVLPLPLTCWECYSNKRRDTNVISQNVEEENIIPGKLVKECEGCHREVPLDNFHKVGKSRKNICKDCVVIETSNRCLNTLKISQIRKMSTVGITADQLANEWKRTRSTCRTMLSYLVKTNHAFFKEIDGKRFYFMNELDAEKLIDAKKRHNKLKPKYEPLPASGKKQGPQIQDKNISILFDNTPEGILLEMHIKGLYLKNVNLSDLGMVIDELILNIGQDVNYEITKEGEKAEIFLDKEEIYKWAYKSLGKILDSFDQSRL